MKSQECKQVLENVIELAKGTRGGLHPMSFGEFDANIALAELVVSAIPELIDAAEEFVAKVERGEAQSKRSYKQFKDALSKLS